MMKKMAYLAVLTSLIGASIFAIDLSIMQLSFFRAIIMGMVFFMVLNALRTNEKIILRSKSENSYSIKVMLIWLIYAVVTVIWVKSHTEWFKAVYFIGLGVMCVIMFSKIFKKTDEVLTCLRIMTIMTIIHNLIGWYELRTGNYIFLASDRIVSYSLKNYPVSIFNNTNNFATFMLISIFIAYICAANSKILLGKCVYVVTMASSAFLLIMTSSRANLLGLILGVAIFGYLSIQNKRGRLTLLVVLSVLFLFTLVTSDALNDYILLLNEKVSLEFSAANGSESVRIGLIKNGFAFLIDTFGCGVGAGNIEYWMSNYGTYYTGSIVNMHNWWMEILTGYGIFIFMLYVTFYIRLYKSFYRKYRITTDKRDATIALGFMCCMAGFIIGSISASSNINSEWLWVFWAITIAYQGISGTTNKLKLQ